MLAKCRKGCGDPYEYKRGTQEETPSSPQDTVISAQDARHRCSHLEARREMTSTLGAEQNKAKKCLGASLSSRINHTIASLSWGVQGEASLSLPWVSKVRPPLPVEASSAQPCPAAEYTLIQQVIQKLLLYSESQTRGVSGLPIACGQPPVAGKQIM